MNHDTTSSNKDSHSYSVVRTTRTTKFVLLTLARHKEGTWITRLVDHLQRHPKKVLEKQSRDDDSKLQGRRLERLIIRVVAVEDLLRGPICISQLTTVLFDHERSDREDGSDDETLTTTVLVNRVSDAAPPHLFKATMALLQMASTISQNSSSPKRTVVVWNGPNAYSSCASKWMHHVIFQQAGLFYPSTALLLFDRSKGGDLVDTNQDSSTELLTPAPHTKEQSYHAVTQAATLCRQEYNDKRTSCDHTGQRSSGQMEFLFKPNAGGFGAGIVAFHGDIPKDENEIQSHRQPSQQESIGHAIGSLSDNTAVVQSYVPPKDGKLYRIWVLHGRIQCAVERQLVDVNRPRDHEEVQQASRDSVTNEFVSGCTGTVCSLPKKNDRSRQEHEISSNDTTNVIFSAWQVPKDVEVEVLEAFKVLGEDAHAGSIEFLQESDTGRRLYFDLNLLSTLPVVGETVKNETGVWPDDYNPWEELAVELFQYAGHYG